MVSLRLIPHTVSSALRFGSTRERYFLLRKTRKGAIDNYVNAKENEIS
jgi:hypothetical protein